MKNPAAETLLNFLAEHPELTERCGRILFIRPVAHPRLALLKKSTVLCLQTFKPEAEKLALQGFKVTSSIEGTFDLVILLPGQQRDENLHNFARAASCLNEGGTVISALSNDLGAGRFERHLKELLGEINSYSRNKCRVFWGQRTSSLSLPLLDEWLRLGDLFRIEGTDLLSCQGIFARKKIDAGSKLLCENLPGELPGRGADLGCGYGYISSHIAKSVRGVVALHLYEAEKLALDAAKANVSAVQTRIEFSFEWHDVTTGLAHRNLDWIVTNPPFHQGKSSATSLGRRFIEVAASALRKDGKLYLVTNENFPYASPPLQGFRESRILSENGGYRVIEAVK